MKLCLDLFAGLGGFSSAFADADGWEVFTVELEEKFDPDLQADILDLRPEDILEALSVDSWDELDEFVVLASPPCTVFSSAVGRLEKIAGGEPQTDEAREAVALVYHTIGLIQGMSPDWWFMENPRGLLRKVIGPPTGEVTYCQYGSDWMKPTDLWGVHPDPFEYEHCSPGGDCHGSENDEEGLADSIRDPAKRAKVPYGLSKSILDSVEHPEPRESLVMWST